VLEQGRETLFQEQGFSVAALAFAAALDRARGAACPTDCSDLPDQITATIEDVTGGNGRKSL
jgi:hypothetical protein